MKTKVIFKKFPDGEIIALFPELAGDNNPYATCWSYQIIGQHGSASVDLARLPAATPDEYAAIKYHLETCCWRSDSYDLQVVKRFSRSMLQKRIADVD